MKARRLYTSLVMVCLGFFPAASLRAQMSPEVSSTAVIAPAVTVNPWWDDAVRQPMRVDGDPINLDLDSAVLGVLMFSPQVKVATDFPIIRQTQVANAAARFDPRAFVDSKFTDTSDPVGNLLTTGGANRFIDQTAISSGGIRKKFTSGGELEAAQRLGYQDNNSNFFIPKSQATSRITLNYTQPLLNGAGKLYNTSTICIAEIQTQEAALNMERELQALLLETHRTYWELHLRRAALLQRMRLKQQAIDIQRELQGRADFDVVRSQVVRADAAVATRDAAVIRFGTEIANTETRLRGLINDPQLNGLEKELVPILLPYRESIEPNLADALTTALQNRQEILAGFAEVRAASVRADVSKNELLPKLDLLLGTYVSGLQGQSNFDKAWINQFDTGRPTYWTGLEFEYPLGNRAPRAQRTQRLVELRLAGNRLQQMMIQTRVETETAVREVVTAHREMLSKYHAMQADQIEIEYLTSRWRLLAGDQQLAGVVLNDLLAAQERLAAAEYDFAAAEAAYNVSLVNLNAVTGILLRTQQVQFVDTFVDGVPAIDVQAQPQSQPTPREAVPPVLVNTMNRFPVLPTVASGNAPVATEAVPPAAVIAAPPRRDARLMTPVLRLPDPTPVAESQETPVITPLPIPDAGGS